MNPILKYIIYALIVILIIAVIYILYTHQSAIAAGLVAFGIGGKVVNDTLNNLAKKSEDKLKVLDAKQDEIQKGVENKSSKEEEDYWKKQ